MSEQLPPDNADEDALEALLQLAGPRRQPPADMRARVLENVRAEYENLSPQPVPQAAPQATPRAVQQDRPWLFAGAAVAATVLLAVALLQFGPWRGAAPAIVAQVAFATGSYSARSEADLGSDILDSDTLGSGIVAGTVLTTAADSRLMITLDGGVSARLDYGTRLTVQSAQELWLHAGRIYLDSPPTAKAGSLRVLAQDAEVRDVGTLFAVEVRDGQLQVAVREGEVAITLADAQRHRATASAGRGERLTFAGQQLSARVALAFNDPSWDWALGAAPEFRLRDASAYDYLYWVAREHGQTLRFTSAAVQATARNERFRSDTRANSARHTVAEQLLTHGLRLLPSEQHELLVDFDRP